MVFGAFTSQVKVPALGTEMLWQTNKQTTKTKQNLGSGEMKKNLEECLSPNSLILSYLLALHLLAWKKKEDAFDFLSRFIER